jgi:hypothetical protein
MIAFKIPISLVARIRDLDRRSITHRIIITASPHLSVRLFCSSSFRPPKISSSTIPRTTVIGIDPATLSPVLSNDDETHFRVRKRESISFKSIQEEHHSLSSLCLQNKRIININVNVNIRSSL